MALKKAKYAGLLGLRKPEMMTGDSMKLLLRPISSTVMWRKVVALRSMSLRIYFLLTGLFWFVGLVVAGGGAYSQDGTTHVKISVVGAVLNGVLLLPLARGREWARLVLMAEALLVAAVVGSIGIPPFGPSFGLLAFIAAGQCAVLIGLRPNRGFGQVGSSPENGGLR